MAEEEKDQQVGGGEPVQLYRFKVRTADGREMVSAVAVVDPNAEGEGKDDAANSAEELEQNHKEHVAELAKHAEESGKGFLDTLLNKGKELAQQHAGELNDVIGGFVAKHHDEITKITGELDKAFEGTHIQFLSDAEKSLTKQ